jgi:hypothetical protein
VPPEQALHEAVAAMCHRLVAAPAQWAFYPAGAIQLTAAQSARLVRMGLKRGWPDLLILHGKLYGIELKREGGQLSRTSGTGNLSINRALIDGFWARIEDAHSDPRQCGRATAV